VERRCLGLRNSWPGRVSSIDFHRQDIRPEEFIIPDDELITNFFNPQILFHEAWALLSSRMSVLPVGKGLMRIFKELVAPARRDPDLESILPDDFDLASVRCNPAMGPPDNYSRGGFNRFDRGKRDIPAKGPKSQDKAFLRNSDRSWEN
jgi:hypothetical protein